MLTASDRTFMQETQEGYMPDQCHILTHSEGAPDARGVRTTVYTMGTAISCGFKYDSTESHTDDDTRVLTDAVMRVPVGTVINTLDHVLLTFRHGAAVVPTQEFEVVGNPLHGPTALQVKLRRVNL